MLLLAGLMDSALSKLAKEKMIIRRFVVSVFRSIKLGFAASSKWLSCELKKGGICNHYCYFVCLSFRY